MPRRKVYHVTPNPGGGWNVKKERGERASARFGTKDPAIKRAKELAKAGGLGQVKIHKKDGTIQTEYTYGEDPHPPEG